jgi:hypothetical protein
VAIARRRALLPHGATLHGAFGDAVSYLAYRPRDRFMPWRLPGCVLWHSTFQHNITRPPTGVRHRLLTVHDLNYRYAGFAPDRCAIGAHPDRDRAQHVAGDDQPLRGADVASNVRWRGPIRTIYNGVTDLSALPSSRFRPGGRRFFLHVSRMARSKNVGAIVAWRARGPSALRARGPAWGHSKRLHDELAGTMPNVTCCSASTIR